MTEELLLEAEEELLWSGGPRLSAAGGAVVTGIVLVALGLGGLLGVLPRLGGVGVLLYALLVLAGLGVPLHGVLAVRRTVYAVSDRAVYARTGVLSRSVRRLGLDRVQNSTWSQSALGGAFGYGTVTVESAGSGAPLEFVRVGTPREVRSLVDRRAGATGRGTAEGLPGSPERWRAVLAEVRALRRALEQGGRR